MSVLPAAVSASQQLFSSIVNDTPRNSKAARSLAQRYQGMYSALKEYEKITVPDRMVEARDGVFWLLTEIHTIMGKWTEKGTYYMLTHQREFEAELDDCNTRLSDCLMTFTTAAHMEWLANDKRWERWESMLNESRFFQDDPDMRTISAMMRAVLEGKNVVLEDKHRRMTMAPVWLGEIPSMGNKNVNVYKGRFLKGEDLKIKVVRFVSTGEAVDGKVTQRIRREIELWAEINEMDQGRHTVPFYGFFMPDGPHLALVSPWMNNGNALGYVKKHNKDIDYPKLVIGIAEGINALHSLAPPIIHGNLRAENILIGNGGQPLISNFALTKIEGTLITQTVNELDGCRWYAPEICGGQDLVSAKSDIYSFGMTVLELYTHKTPYANIRNNFQVINKKMGDDGVPDRPRDERVMERGLGDNVWEFLCQCWSKDPKDRPSMTPDRVEEITHKFPPSTRKERINKSNAGETELTVEENKEIQSNPIKLLLQSLLTILKLKSRWKNWVAKQVVLDLVRALLDLPNYDIIVSETKEPSDVELLLDLILGVLRDSSLSGSGIQDAGRKARVLMFRLISKTDVVPKSLFITDVRAEADLGVVERGGFGHVLRGKYKGEQVALKALDKGHHNRSLRQEFCREALTWRSLTHQFILPLWGIFEENSQLFLVSPFMTNGTLTQWRKKNQTPSVAEIHRLMREVAQGIQYLHSEGIVHGDLHGKNVLLDAEFHCQITDFGLTRHSEAPFTRPTTTFVSHFAAPELYGMCFECANPDCHGCGEESRRKTMRTDVYAYGCLYYVTFFDMTPFEEMNEYQIMRSVISGIHPERLESPILEDEVWDVIQGSWKTKPSERLTMEQIVERLTEST